MTMKPLHAGDKVRLLAPEYGEPQGECVVIASQKGGLVWFTAVEGGACHVARRQALQVVKRIQP